MYRALCLNVFNGTQCDMHACECVCSFRVQCRMRMTGFVCAVSEPNWRSSRKIWAHRQTTGSQREGGRRDLCSNREWREKVLTSQITNKYLDHNTFCSPDCFLLVKIKRVAVHRLNFPYQAYLLSGGVCSKTHPWSLSLSLSTQRGDSNRASSQSSGFSLTFPEASRTYPGRFPLLPPLNGEITQKHQRRKQCISWFLLFLRPFS